jgi:hypothetical protein
MIKNPIIINALRKQSPRNSRTEGRGIEAARKCSCSSTYDNGRICPPGGRRDGRLPGGGLLLLLRAFRIRRLGLLIRALRMLLGLGRVFLAFGMLIPAMRLGSGTMGLCSGLVKFGRLVV